MKPGRMYVAVRGWICHSLMARGLLLALVALPAPMLFAEQLTPRAFWPTPVGTNVLVLQYQRSEGDVIVDQSLPVVGVESVNDFALLSYQRSFDFQGRSASFSIGQGFADGDTKGVFEGEEFRVRNVGALDTIGRLAVNLRGAPAMNRKEFAALRSAPPTIVGAALTVSAPTGDYDPDRVINLGSNRWAIQPEIGVIYPVAPSLLLETSLGVWFFQDNDEFVGSTREQDPICVAQVHLIKRFKPGFWAALDANFYIGGRTRIDGELKSDLQRNSRIGGTLVFPTGRGSALRASFSVGTVTKTGGDFELFSLGWIQAF